MNVLLSPILSLPWYFREANMESSSNERRKHQDGLQQRRWGQFRLCQHRIPSPSVNTLAIRTRTAKTPPSHLAAAMSDIASCVLAPVTTLPGPVKVTFCFICTRHHNIARTPVQIHVRADASWEGAGGRRRHTILASLRRSRRKSLIMRARDGTELKGCNMGSRDQMSEAR